MYDFTISRGEKFLKILCTISVVFFYFTRVHKCHQGLTNYENISKTAPHWANVVDLTLQITFFNNNVHCQRNLPGLLLFFNARNKCEHMVTKNKEKSILF